MRQTHRQNALVLLLLALFALFIWLRNTDWMSRAEDTLPILAAFPLFWWLGSPWQLQDRMAHFPATGVVIVILLSLMGVILNLTLLLASAWVYALWLWLKEKTAVARRGELKKLMTLLLMAFPWVTLDLQTAGWYFRLSGAFIAAQIFALFGYRVKGEGTTLLVDSLPISVEAACAGLNTLQSLLIAGTVVAYLFLNKSQRFWYNLPLLFVMAWLANTARILLLSAVALLAGPAFAMGAFHTWGGWLILTLMFLGCWFLFQLQEPKSDET